MKNGPAKIWDESGLFRDERGEWGMENGERRTVAPQFSFFGQLTISKGGRLWKRLAKWRMEKGERRKEKGEWRTVVPQFSFFGQLTISKSGRLWKRAAKWRKEKGEWRMENCIASFSILHSPFSILHSPFSILFSPPSILHLLLSSHAFTTSLRIVALRSNDCGPSHTLSVVMCVM